MSRFQEDGERAQLAKRAGDNEPLHLKAAVYDGRRSVRLVMPRGHIGLATATYSYDLTHLERCEVAERLAALWNLGAVLSLSTAEIVAALCIKRTKREPNTTAYGASHHHLWWW
jgi:hypothetical protein